MARHALSISTVFCFCIGICSLPAFGQLRSDQLLPDTTKAYVSIPDADDLGNKFVETQLGQLSQDPLMQPFVEDLREQIKDKMSAAGVRVGITLDDVKMIRGGEISISMIQPGGNKDQHALALIVDVTGKVELAQQLLDKVKQDQLKAGAKQETEKFDGGDAMVLVVNDKATVYFIQKNFLVAVDHREAAKDIAKHFKEESAKSLGNLEAYKGTMAHVQKSAGNTQPHIKWFIEPFGYAQVAKASIPKDKKKRAKDNLPVIMKQGFDAIKGIGGYVTFKVNEHELEHHSFIYAPAVKGAPAKEKYRLAARMMNFPNQANMVPLDWIPRDLSVHVTFNAKIKESFEYVGSLVDAMADAPGVWEDILAGLLTDPQGPQVDIKKDLVAYAGERITVLSDYRLPITPKSERLAIAIEVSNPQSVAKAIAKIMKSDPNARPLTIDGYEVWEIVEDKGEEEIDFKIEGEGFTATGTVKDKVEDDKQKPSIPNSAVTVAHGHLLIATHVDFIKELLKKPEPPEILGNAADFKLVEAALTKLGAKDDSAKFFSRTDESFRPTYELLKQGKMPQAETLLGKTLNKLFDQGQGVVRKQQIDATKMPDFQAVRRYLGPAGAYVRSVDDGWMITGCLLTKEEAK